MPIHRVTPGGLFSADALSAGRWSRRSLVGLPVVLALAGCSYENPYREVDDAVVDALKSEPMWISYRPAWVESESTMLIPRGPDLPGTHNEMVSDRFLRGNPLRASSGTRPT